MTFLSRPIPRALDAGPEDRRVVQTDKRGMFRVELDNGHAVGVTMADGRRTAKLFSPKNRREPACTQ